MSRIIREKTIIWLTLRIFRVVKQLIPSGYYHKYREIFLPAAGLKNRINHCAKVDRSGENKGSVQEG